MVILQFNGLLIAYSERRCKGFKKRWAKALNMGRGKDTSAKRTSPDTLTNVQLFVDTYGQYQTGMNVFVV